MDITTLCDQFCDYSAYIRGYTPDTIKRYRTTVHLLRARTGIRLPMA